MNEMKAGGELVRSVRHSGDTVFVAVSGEIDLNNSPHLRNTLIELLNRFKPRRLVLNLGDVPYMDSSAIAVLVEMLRKLGKGIGKVFLTNLQPRVRGLLEIARLHTIFDIVDDEKDVN